MVEFALGYICGALTIGIAGLFVLRGEKPSLPLSVPSAHPDNRKALAYSRPSKVREIEEFATGGEGTGY